MGHSGHLHRDLYHMTSPVLRNHASSPLTTWHRAIRLNRPLAKAEPGSTLWRSETGRDGKIGVGGIGEGERIEEKAPVAPHLGRTSVLPPHRSVGAAGLVHRSEAPPAALPLPPSRCCDCCCAPLPTTFGPPMPPPCYNSKHIWAIGW